MDVKAKSSVTHNKRMAPTVAKKIHHILIWKTKTLSFSPPFEKKDHSILHGQSFFSQSIILYQGVDIRYTVYKQLLVSQLCYSQQAAPYIFIQDSGNILINYRQDYIKHPLERPFVRVPEQYKRPQGEMEGMTSYKKEYTGIYYHKCKISAKKKS